MTTELVRDFIYLDIERVRSFAAQLFGGLPSERITIGEHQAGAEGNVKSGIPAIVGASGGVNYHYLRSQSETTSLHDHLFAEFMGALAKASRLSDLSKVGKSAWEERLFKDGAFFHIQCPLKIVDYKANVALLEVLPDVQNLAAQATGDRPHPDKRLQGTTKPVAPQQKNPQQMRQQIRATTGLMNQFYGDLIRVKLFPFSDSPDRVLVGTGHRDMFRYSAASLATIYGAVIDAGWTCVLQVNRGIPHAAGSIVSSTGNIIEDSFEKLVDQFTELSSMTQGIAFPAVAITPIAIYREVA